MLCYINLRLIMELRIVDNGTITSPRGFEAGAVHAGLKTRETGQPDLGILRSEVPCTGSGVFTTNRIKAAPVVLSQRRLSQGRPQALVVNAGYANAFVGERGMGDAEAMAALAAHNLNLAPESVLVASTGVTGVPLPLDKVRSGLGKIKLSREGGHELARAITTTDTFAKEMAVSWWSGQSQLTLGGIAKGAGMIHPNLATMLCFLTTDALVDAECLRQALRQAVDVSFNMITVDGDTSPNDMVLILANGLAGNDIIVSNTPAAQAFQSALTEVCLYLAKSIARDGEGATRLLEVRVEGAFTLTQARTAARAIARSPLVKAAVHGCDPNWGRIINAVGYSGVEVVESKVDVWLGEVQVMATGTPRNFDGEAARAVLGRDEVSIRVNLNLGQGEATAWGCDLSEEYVVINSAYTT